MQKLDRRIQRTQRLLMDALVELSLEKGYDHISIREITARADVAYSTFFRHYAEKGDLLVEVLHAAIQEFKWLLSDKRRLSTKEEGEIIFQYVMEHQAFFRVLFSSQGTSHILRDIQEELAEYVLQSGSVPANTTVPPEIAANHLIITILALIRWWLDHDLPYSIQRMATFYSHLTAQEA